ncbi:MAG: hypothetical protein V1874_02060 [Spirochaetota bacterium]
MEDDMTAGALVFLGICIITASFIIISIRAFQMNPALVKKIFKYMIIVAIAAGFSIASVAIGFRLSERNTSSLSKSFRSVSEIWGGEMVQGLPSFQTESIITEQYIVEKTGQYANRQKNVYNSFGFKSHRAEISIKSNIRQKGLLKFAGYNMKFKGIYECENTDSASNTFYFTFPLPENAGNISDMKVIFNGKDFKGDTDLADGVDWYGLLAPGQKISFEISYAAQGTGSFRYGKARAVKYNDHQSADYQAQNVHKSVNKIEIGSFDTKLETDFKDITVLDGTMAPAENNSDSAGTVVKWRASKLILDQDIGLKFEISANYGVLFSKIFFYAPLTIFLFLAFLLIFTASKSIVLHPMHYIFIIAGFFVFYLLGSYAVTYMHIFAAIVLSLVISSVITWYYTRAIGKGRELEKIAGLCLAVFQWFFSAAFFFPEHTGMLITLASIAALIVLMKITASTDWENKW